MLPNFDPQKEFEKAIAFQKTFVGLWAENAKKLVDTAVEANDKTRLQVENVATQYFNFWNSLVPNKSK